MLLSEVLGLKKIPYLGCVITQEGIKSDTKKVQGIMDLGQPTTTTESRALIGIVQKYRDMWTRRFHILSPLIEADIPTKSRKILWNDALEDSFKELNCMVSAQTLLSYPDWIISFTVYTNASDKKLGGVISQNNKPVSFFSRRLMKPQN